MLKRLLLTLAVLLATLTLAPAASADVGDSATGSGTTEKHVFSFAATGGADNSGTGTMEIRRSGSGGTASVRCLIVEGNNAVIVGTVTTSNDEIDTVVGSDLMFIVTDNATPGAGSDLFDFDFPGFESCGLYAVYLGTASELVRSGEITVVESRTAADQLADLIAQLQSAPVGPGNSYLAKLQAIADSIGGGNTQAACNQLGAFENEVRAQAGKKLTQEEADVLLAEAAAIKTNVGCPSGAGNITPPTITDARIVTNLGTTDFVDSGDSFSLTFSETMNGVTTGNIGIQDQDGTTAQITCSAAAGANQATCSWNTVVTTVTVTLAGTLATIDVGTTPGIQIPFDITALTGFADLQGNVPNLGSGDRRVDFE